MAEAGRRWAYVVHRPRAHRGGVVGPRVRGPSSRWDRLRCRRIQPRSEWRSGKSLVALGQDLLLQRLASRDAANFGDRTVAHPPQLPAEGPGDVWGQDDVGKGPPR